MLSGSDSNMFIERSYFRLGAELVYAVSRV